MAEASAMKARLARLQAELTQDCATIAQLAQQIATQARPASSDEAALALLALRVHRYYTAFESALERIERTFDASPTGPDWHTALLEGAALELVGVRPRVLPPGVARLHLREVLKFRHFFRQAYAVELDATKLAVVADHVVAACTEVDEALREFLGLVASLAHQLG